ncbi:hypothetical protein GCM10010178_82060 [Lentzea flava]|uniref:Uncharacterized protein n=1 Tax=Lentzea flava TaxID=103732 RepID=A0ABQ2VBJ5_9PSEU|nr:hypothetical protein GCM10010178_82060 [Lentzea flava]
MTKDADLRPMAAEAEPLPKSPPRPATHLRAAAAEPGSATVRDIAKALHPNELPGTGQPRGVGERTSLAAPATPSPLTLHTPAHRTTIGATQPIQHPRRLNPAGRCAWRDRGHGAGVSTAEPAARKDHSGGDSHPRRAASGATKTRLAQTRAPALMNR